ncbi:MAG TPA: protocatechuate 3,4-dioxygenase subunit beta [Acidimicrobiia bacterium]|nr:protocatechuate 3,4-dioxygenase subunit beta [Acidimicrobiia bacterium]
MTDPVIRHYGPKAYSDHPPFSYPDYKSTVLRGPKQDLLTIVQTLSETTGPGPIWTEVSEEDADLTTNAGTGEAAIGERIIVTGRVLDEDGNGIPGVLMEIWQANACGRYVHWRETEFPAPLDPNFIGVGQCVTGDDGTYRFLTIKPGPYPWGNHPNAWRPAHIHFSFMGPSLGSRLVTQMYFENDPLFPFDPIFNSAPEHTRHRMVAGYDHDVTEENWALGWRWDVVLRGNAATPFEEDEE